MRAGPRRFRSCFRCPLGLVGAVAALTVRGMYNDIYVQIGLVLLIALGSKNAILIVEFARELRAEGRDLFESAVEAARLRLRAVLMTAIAFILGTYPLVIAAGAGAASRQALGTTVFGGMIAATFLNVLFVPVFFVIVQGTTEWVSAKLGGGGKLSDCDEAELRARAEAAAANGGDERTAKLETEGQPEAVEPDVKEEPDAKE